MPRVEISGEVDYVDNKGQIMAPGIARPNQKTIPVLRIRVLSTSGKLVQVLYKGDYCGDVTLNHEIKVKGIDRGGVIHAKSIFNKTTNSWVTKKPGPFDCFIATAVYGSPHAREVILFKVYRDDHLVKNWLGKILIYLYSILSPPIARKISKNRLLKISIKYALIIPFLRWVKFMLKAHDIKRIS